MSEPSRGITSPAGDVAEWYSRGRELLAAGDAAAAAAVLAHASVAEPESRAISEMLGRAQFQSGDHRGARATFEKLVEADPVDDYARFALGLASLKLGDTAAALTSLTLAVTMRPDNADYVRAREQAIRRVERES